MSWVSKLNKIITRRKQTINQLPTTSWGKIESKKFKKDNDNNVALWHTRNQFVTQQHLVSFVDFTLGSAGFEQLQLTLLHQRSMMIIFLSFAIDFWKGQQDFSTCLVEWVKPNLYAYNLQQIICLEYGLFISLCIHNDRSYIHPWM
jgi:hypothetical protein